MGEGTAYALTGAGGTATAQPAFDRLKALLQELAAFRAWTEAARSSTMELAGELAGAHSSIDQGLAVARVFQKYCAPADKPEHDKIVGGWERLRKRLHTKSGSGVDVDLVSNGPASTWGSCSETIVAIFTDPSYEIPAYGFAYIPLKHPKLAGWTIGGIVAAAISELASSTSPPLAALYLAGAARVIDAHLGELLFEGGVGLRQEQLSGPAQEIIDGRWKAAGRATLDLLTKLAGNTVGPTSLTVAAMTIWSKNQVSKIAEAATPAVKVTRSAQFISRSRNRIKVAAKFTKQEEKAFDTLMDKFEEMAREQKELDSLERRLKAQHRGSRNAAARARMERQLVTVKKQVTKVKAEVETLSKEVRGASKRAAKMYQGGKVASGLLTMIGALQLALMYSARVPADETIPQWVQRVSAATSASLGTTAAGIQCITWKQPAHPAGVQISFSKVPKTFAATPTGKALGRLASIATMFYGFAVLVEAVEEGNVTQGISGMFTGLGAILVFCGGSLVLVGGALGALAILIDVSTLSFKSNVERGLAGRRAWPTLPYMSTSH